LTVYHVAVVHKNTDEHSINILFLRKIESTFPFARGVFGMGIFTNAIEDQGIVDASISFKISNI